MNENTMQQGINEADQARAELYITLAQLRDRLDYAQRIDDSVSRTKRRLAQKQRESPAAFAAGVGVVAVGCGLAVWAITRKVIRAF